MLTLLDREITKLVNKENQVMLYLGTILMFCRKMSPTGQMIFFYHILHTSVAKLCPRQTLMYGVIDIKDIGDGKDEFVLTDIYISFSLNRFVTNDDRFYTLPSHSNFRHRI